MKLGLKLLVLMAILNLNLPVTGSLPNNNAGFNFEPIQVDLYTLFQFAQYIALTSPQLVTIIPEINVIASSSNSLAENLFRQKEITAYTNLVISLVLYFYNNDSLDLTLIANYIGYMLPSAQTIAGLIPQIANTIIQMESIDPSVNNVTTTEEQLVYIAMVMGYLTYFAYLQSPF